MVTFRFTASAEEGELIVKCHACYPAEGADPPDERFLGQLEMTTFEWGRFYAALIIGCDRLRTEIKVEAINAKEAIKQAEAYIHVDK